MSVPRLDGLSSVVYSRTCLTGNATAWQGEGDTTWFRLPALETFGLRLGIDADAIAFATDEAEHKFVIRTSAAC